MQLPDLAEQRGQPRVLRPPRHQHLGVGMVKGAQLRQPPDEAGEMLRVLGVMDLRVLVEDAQERLLQLFYVPLVPQQRAVCGGARHSAVTARPPPPEGVRGSAGTAYLRTAPWSLRAERTRSR